MAQFPQSCTKIKVVLASSDVKLFLNFCSPIHVGVVTDSPTHMALNSENRVNFRAVQAGRVPSISCEAFILLTQYRANLMVEDWVWLSIWCHIDLAESSKF